jgi:hypothetical protein
MFLWTDRQAVFLKVMLVVCAMALAHPVPVGRSNMLFLVAGTPWKTPRSSRFCCPDCGDSWFGGRSSTKTATLRMRLRNSCGSESRASSTTFTKCSRFILHPLK